MNTLPGKPNTVPKKDFHSTPQENSGPPICQTTLLIQLISGSRHQSHKKNSLRKPRKLKIRPKKMPCQRRRRPLRKNSQRRTLELKKPPQPLFNSTENHTNLPKRSKSKEFKNLNPPQLTQTPTAVTPVTQPHQDPIEDQMLSRQINYTILEKLLFSDREFVFKEFK